MEGAEEAETVTGTIKVRRVINGFPGLEGVGSGGPSGRVTEEVPGSDEDLRDTEGRSGGLRAVHREGLSESGVGFGQIKCAQSGDLSSFPGSLSVSLAHRS